MKVLLVSHGFPPMANSGMLRPLRFVRGLIAAGHEVVVLAAEEAYFPLLSDELIKLIPSGVKVERVETPSRYHFSLIQRFQRKLKSHLPLYDRVATGFAILMRMLLKADYPGLTLKMNRAIQQFVSRGRELAQDCDVVLATTQPFWILSVGGSVAAACQKPLVLDYQDLWTKNPVYVAKRRERARERALMRQAVAALTVSRGCSAIMAEVFPEQKEKIHTLLNGFDYEMYPSSAPSSSSKLALAYVGNNYGGRTLVPLVKALSLLRSEAISLDVWGSISAEEQEQMQTLENDSICYHGVVAREVALEGLSHCDLALVTQIPGDEMSLPQKMYDAIALNKGLLFIGKPNENQRDVLRSVELPVLAGETAKELVALLKGLLTDKQRGAIPAPDKEKAACYETTAQTQKLVNILRGCLVGQQRDIKNARENEKSIA